MSGWPRIGRGGDAGRVVYGSDSAGAGAGAKSEADAHGDLAQQSSNPGVPLMNFAFIDYYSPSFHNLPDARQNYVLFRALLPFKIGCAQHILRLSLPLVTESPADVTGTGDLVAFDLIVWEVGHVIWGAGAVLSLPTGEVGLSSEKWSAGPAFVAVVTSGKLTWGMLNQNFFSFAGDDAAPDVAQSIFQPFATLNLGCGWTIGTSEMLWTYDWEAERWNNFPVGVSLAVVKPIQGQPVKFSLSADYNLADDVVGPETTFTFGVTFLFPKH